MKEDKAYYVRKTFTVICLILFFSTVGLFMINSQLKTVTLDYHGDKQTIKTMATNVQDFLIQNKISLNNNEKIWPETSTELENGMVIEIESTDQLAKIDIDKMIKDNQVIIAKIEEVIEDVPYEEEKQNNSTLDRGVTNVLKEGKDGKICTKYLVRYNNGEVVERAKIGTEVLSEVENQVIEIGTKIITSSRSNIVQSAASSATDAGFRYYNIPLSREYQEYAYNICKKYGIQYELLLAVMYCESGFNVNASSGTAYGLCQIHYSNYSNLSSKLGITDLFDPYDNMTSGAYMLSLYLNNARKFVSEDSVEVYALNSYNMGDAAYYSQCFSQGILNRAYSNKVISVKNSLISRGTI